MLYCSTTIIRRRALKFVGTTRFAMSTASDRKTELLDNLNKIKNQIPSASRDSVLLVAVSKLKPASDIQIAYDAGHRHFGKTFSLFMTNAQAHVFG